MSLNQSHARSDGPSWSYAALALGVAILTLVASWANGRWPQESGRWITIVPQQRLDVVSTLWYLDRLDGVEGAVAMYRVGWWPDEVGQTGWREAWVCFGESSSHSGAFLPPAPGIKVGQGRLPNPDSLTETVVGYELASQLGLRIGTTVMIRGEVFTVVGIWEPSGRNAGNTAQVSMVAGRIFWPEYASIPHQFVVVTSGLLPADSIATSIWTGLPEVSVASPAAEADSTRRERGVLLLALAGAVLLLGLLAVAQGAATRSWAAVSRPATVWSLVGLTGGWLLAVAGNGYMRRTLALSPLRCSAMVMGAVLAIGWVTAWMACRVSLVRSATMRTAAVVATVALAVGSTTVVGALRDSLRLALGDAARTASDRITLMGVPATPDFIRAALGLPGTRGYVIEARGGPLARERDRWLGSEASAGYAVGLDIRGGVGTLTVPYSIGLEAGRLADPNVWYEVTVGHDLALHLGLCPDMLLPVRGVDLTVVGIHKRLMYGPGTDMNYRVQMSLEGLRRVFRDPSTQGELTLLIPPSRDPDQKAYYLRLVADRMGGVRVQTVEDRMAEIVSAYPAAGTLTLSSSRGLIRHGSDLYLALVAGCSLMLFAASGFAIQAAVGGRLVQDRKRVALSKAMGVDDGRIIAEYTELTLSWVGAASLLGSFLGWRIVTLLEVLEPMVPSPLLLTPQAVAWPIACALLTAVLTAIPTAVRAVRRDVAALLYSTEPAIEG